MSQSLDQHLGAFQITMSIWTHRSWPQLLGPSLPSNDRQGLDSLSGVELISLLPYSIEDSVSPSHLESPAEGRQSWVSTFHRLPGYDWEILIETRHRLPPIVWLSPLTRHLDLSAAFAVALSRFPKC